MSVMEILKLKNTTQIFYQIKWDKYLINKREEESKTGDRQSSFHASSIADKNFCLVKAILDEITGREKDIFPPRTLSIFWNGIDVHKRHQKFLKETKMAYFIEKQCYSEFLDMTGTADAIIDFLNKTTIQEIKSMNTFQFKKLETPALKAYNQAQIYMYLWGIPQSIIIVEDKNDQKIKVFLIKFDLESAIKLINRRVVIIYCLKKNIIPETKRVCKRAKISKRCKFKDVCFNKKYLENLLRINQIEK